jgi:L-2-hydroxyglutarate oxidase LhgO
MNESVYDLVIVGGGIVGLASAYSIQYQFPKMKILLLEKEQELASHQTGNNSGVLHSGIYYTPSSLKARLCVKGRQQMVDYAVEKNIPHDVCGKVIVATQESELERLKEILSIGKQNDLKNLSWIDPQQIKEYEPYCEGIAGIHVPVSGIINYKAVAEQLATDIKAINNQSQILIGQEVRGIQKMAGLNQIKTKKSSFSAKKMIFCGGLFADRLARKQGLKIPERIVGFRGDYYELTPQAQHKVRNLIYPVPDSNFPFLGVHFTRMIEGGIECGPNAVFTFEREGYGKTDFNLHDTLDALGYAGTWNLFKKHWRYGLEEYKRAFSKEKFLATLQRLIPSLTMNDISQGRSGVRAVLLSPEGETRSDFRIENGEDSLHILNAPSPAATASLAIGKEIRDMAIQSFGW